MPKSVIISSRLVAILATGIVCHNIQALTIEIAGDQDLHTTQLRQFLLLVIR